MRFSWIVFVSAAACIGAASACFAAAPMGWNSWNSFANIVDSKIVQEQARAMASNGMKQAGYEYVVIDEGWWLGQRDSAGHFIVDEKRWPALKAGEKAGDMANIAAYIHGLGLKAGIYTDAGKDGCSMYPDSGPKILGAGSEGHYDEDFLQFSKWGFDYVKVDWCGGAKERLSGARQYAEIAHAIEKAEKATGRKLFFSICEWGSQNPWVWAPGVGGIESTIWRTGGDIIPPVVESLHDPEHEKRVITAKNVLESFDAGLHPEAQHTGYYNDLDMMVMGMRGMDAATDRVHMGLWAISSAPMMVGSDLTRLPAGSLVLLTNAEALAVHNDAYGLQPIKVDEPEAGVQVWAKPMAVAGRRAVALVNRTGSVAQVKVDWAKMGLVGAPKRVRDVFGARDVAAGEIGVPAHDLVLLVVEGEDKPPVSLDAAGGGSVSGIEALQRPAFVRVHYGNDTGGVVVARVKSTSGLETGVALAPAKNGVVGMILPKGTADLEFAGDGAVVRGVDWFGW